MNVQEQAFRAYYASMSDGDLLRTAANRSSFIPIAQQILAEEIARRKLVAPAESQPQAGQTPGILGGAVHRLGLKLRHRQTS
jgi:hypothetical protein